MAGPARFARRVKKGFYPHSLRSLRLRAVVETGDSIGATSTDHPTGLDFRRGTLDGEVEVSHSDRGFRMSAQKQGQVFEKL